ncbi:peptidase S8/S53 domain-containing protein, partial [Lactarius pseudohatsudake]
QAIPDVSAQAYFFRILLKGSPVLIGGTSAAAPSFAAFVALLNDVRLTHGRPSLGFLNPLLYGLNGAGFNNITTGNAPGCCTPGFIATAGWDPVTGFGTPDFGKL